MVGVTIDAVGAVESAVPPVLLTVTVRVSTPSFPAASIALMEIWFDPYCSGTDVDQFVSPLATPLRFLLMFLHLTCVTPMLSDDVPPSAIELPIMVNVEALVGEEMVTVGRVPSEPVGGGVVPPPLAAAMVHVKVWFGLVRTPSETRAIRRRSR